MRSECLSIVSMAFVDVVVVCSFLVFWFLPFAVDTQLAKRICDFSPRNSLIERQRLKGFPDCFFLFVTNESVVLHVESKLPVYKQLE